MAKLSPQATRGRNAIARTYGIRRGDPAGEAILQATWEAWDTWHKAQDRIDEEGLTVAGDRGGVKAHPLLAVIRDQRAQFYMGLKALRLDVIQPRDKPGRPPGR